jgi:hypothetical protein
VNRRVVLEQFYYSYFRIFDFISIFIDINIKSVLFNSIAGGDATWTSLVPTYDDRAS